MVEFVTADRKTAYLLPPSMQDWLNEGPLARFIAEVVDPLDRSNLTRQYAGHCSKAHHPATLLAILVCGYAPSTGQFRAGVGTRSVNWPRRSKNTPGLPAHRLEQRCLAGDR
jgi:hypothetical protein